VAQIGGDGPHLAFAGHTDVVTGRGPGQMAFRSV
jgi:hypothetical protein